MTDLAIVGGDVWDGTGRPVEHGATVLVAQGRIESVGRGIPVPPEAEMIDATGRTVMPGLIDSHVHIQLCGEDSLFGFLGTGVTTVRDLGSDVGELLPLRDQIDHGDRVGPRVAVYGPLLDGEPAITGGGAIRIARALSGPEEGRAVIDELIQARVDGIKLYAGLRPDLLQELVAHVAGRVPVTGHLGRTWASEAVEAGIDGLEHVHATIYQDVVLPEDRHGREDGNGGRPDYWTWLLGGWARADLDADYVGRFIDQLVESRVAMSPTTVLITGGWATSEALSEPGQRFRTRFMAERVRQRRALQEQAEREGAPPSMPPVAPEVGALARAKQLEFLSRLHARGGIIVPSTDVGAAPMQVPGFSLHRELALLAEAGISNADVLAAATRVAAGVLGWGDEVGTLEPGKRADLLLIRGDPLSDITSSREVEVVVAAGQRHDPERLLGQIETSWES